METINRAINCTYPNSVQLIFIFSNNNIIKITRVANVTTAKAVADLINNKKVQALAPFTYEETIIKDKEAIIYLESGLSSKHDIVSIILELVGLTQITSNVRG